jgi:hypothetical protein
MLVGMARDVTGVHEPMSPIPVSQIAGPDEGL